MIIFTTQHVEPGSDFWYELSPEDLAVSDFSNIQAEYITIDGNTTIATLTLDDGIEENDAGTGWIVKLSKEITGDSNTPISEYDCKLTFTLSTGQVIVKTVPKLIKIK